VVNGIGRAATITPKDKHDWPKPPDSNESDDGDEPGPATSGHSGPGDGPAAPPA